MHDGTGHSERKKDRQRAVAGYFHREHYAYFMAVIEIVIEEGYQRDDLW